MVKASLLDSQITIGIDIEFYCNKYINNNHFFSIQLTTFSFHWLVFQRLRECINISVDVRFIYWNKQLLLQVCLLIKRQCTKKTKKKQVKVFYGSTLKQKKEGTQTKNEKHEKHRLKFITNCLSICYQINKIIITACITHIFNMLMVRLVLVVVVGICCSHSLFASFFNLLYISRIFVFFLHGAARRHKTHSKLYKSPIYINAPKQTLWPSTQHTQEVSKLDLIR